MLIKKVKSRIKSSKDNERGVSTVIAVTLIVALVIVLAAVIAAIIFGSAIFVHKSAFVPVNATIDPKFHGGNVVNVFNRGGDVTFHNISASKNLTPKVRFEIDTPSGGWWKVAPNPDPSRFNSTRWAAGDSVYIYKGTNGNYWMVDNPSKLVDSEITKIDSPIGVRVIDATQEILIARINVGSGNGTGPTITSITTDHATAGSPDTTIVITGTNFVTGTVVIFGGITLTPTSVTSTSLTVTIPQIYLTNPGIVQVSVTNPNGSTSGQVPFTITSLTGPTITSLTPNEATSGSPDITMTVTGTNFISGSTVYWGTTPLTTTFGNSTSLTATIPAGLLVNTGPFSITVQNPGGITSGAVTFTVNVPSISTPTITNLNPSSTTQNGAGFNMVVTGTNYVNGAVVYWGTTPLTTTFGNSTSLTATIPAGLLVNTGSFDITVQNPGGNTSGAAIFTVSAQSVPTITSLNPASTTAGSPDISMSVSGTNFVNGAVVYWGTTALTTTFGSSTTLTATVPSSLLTTTGSFSITVKNPDNGTSGPTTFTVNALPTITSLNPASTTAGSPDISMSVSGTNFVNGAVVYWGTTALTTTFGSSTSLTATVPSTLLTTTGSFSITVKNPDNGASGPATFAVNAPNPIITSLNPSSATQNGAGFTMTVTGTNFVNGAVVYWGTTALTTTFGSSTTLTATVPSTLLTTVGSLDITVKNPDNGTSGPATFTVNAQSVPTITGLNPSSATQNGLGFDMDVSGTNFENGAIVYWGTTALTTTYVGSTTLTATVPSSLLTATGSFSITVKNPDNGTSGPATFTVSAQSVPTITDLSPSSAIKDEAGFTMTVTGTNYVNGAIVYWGSTALTTTFGSSTSLTATVPSTLLTATGSFSITVKNPDNGTSGPATFTVNAPSPTITSLNPSSATQNGAGFTITVTGTNYVNGAMVYWGNTALTTTFGSSTSLTATVPSSLLTATGSLDITVKNPDGGTSGPAIFTINAPNPAITSLNPSSATAGSSDISMSVAGTNFVNGAVVYWGSTALATTFGSSTSLTATIPATLLTATGSFSITVKNPDNGTSGPATFTVIAKPTITNLNPSSATQNGAGFTMTVTGTNYVNGAVVYWGSTALTTTFGSSTSLTATVPSTLLTAAGSFSITVKNPSGATSGPATFTVNALPTITSLNPSSATQNGAGFTMTVTGANYVNGAVVYWGSTALTTTFGSSTSLTATVPSTLLTTAGSFSITVKNPDNGTSGPASFTVSAQSVPTITSLNPSSAIQNGAGFTMTVTGTNYVNGAIVYWGSTALTTTFGSSTSLTATVPATLLTTTGSFSIIVKNPDNGTSGPATFTVNAPSPTITNLNPSSATQNGAGFTMTVTGTNYVNGAVVYWGSTALTTTFGSSTSLTATVPSTLLTTAGSFSITVKNPSGSTSGPATFTVNALPTITSLNPSSATQNGAGFTMTVTGTNYVNGAIVYWGSTALTTTFGSSTSLTATVPSTLLTATGSFSITVKNPSGATSGPATFTVNALIPTITAISPGTAAVGSSTFTMTITGTNFVSGAKVYWGSTALTTTFGSSTSLTASVPSSLLTTAGSFSITVKNPDNGTSGPATFYVVQSYTRCSDTDDGKVWGYVFNDANSNGVWDSSETSITGVTITAKIGSTTYTYSSGTSGYYETTCIEHGTTYKISTSLSGYTVTTGNNPTSGTMINPGPNGAYPEVIFGLHHN